VTAPPQYINVINDIATKFVPSKISDTTIVKIIPLKYAWAYDMTFNYANGSISVPGVSSLLQSIVTGQQLSAALSPFNVNVGGNQKQIEYQQMVGMLDDTPPYAKDINNNIKSAQKDGKFSDNGKNDKSSGDKSSGDSNSVDISGTSLPGFITCDQRLNAIIIRDRRENMPFYEEIISKLDVPCEVIKIDVAIVDVNKTSSLALGIPGIQTKLPSGAEIALSMTDSGSAATASTATLGKAVTASIAGHLGVIKSGTINPVIDALEKNSNGQAVSRPSVLTLDNVAAILETDKVHYATISGANNSNAYTQSATTKLQVVPHIIPGDVDGDGKHKMKLFVDISDGSFDAAPDNQQASAVTQHSLNTQSVLYEGQSLVIGGYDSEVNQKKDSGIPILQHLPLVGMLFKHTTNSKEIKERIYVISPSVVEIRSDDHKYDRFVQNGQLAATGTLESDDYPLTTQWPKEKRSKPKRPNPRLN
jgi:type III secretion protein C